jgi:hypothetical protein
MENALDWLAFLSDGNFQPPGPGRRHAISLDDLPSAGGESLHSSSSIPRVRSLPRSSRAGRSIAPRTIIRTSWAKNLRYPYIVFDDLPKIANLKRLFPELYRSDPMLVGVVRS